MKQSSLSMLVFGVYMACLCVGCLFFPKPFVTFFGFPPPDDLWVRLFGLIMGILTFYYGMAIREHAIQFYRWTAYARHVLLPGYVAFVLLGFAPPILIAFGVFESGCALWTGLALRKEAVSGR